MDEIEPQFRERAATPAPTDAELWRHAAATQLRLGGTI